MTTDNSNFGHEEDEKRENRIKAIELREAACDNEHLSDGAVRLFVRVLDMSLNPWLNNGRKGRVVVSQSYAGKLLHVDERSIRRYNEELDRCGIAWTSLEARPGSKPITVYHITSYDPKKQVRQVAPGEGMYGGKKLRYDSGYIKGGQNVTGQKRRGGSGLLDARGNPVSSLLLENVADRGQSRPVTEDKIVLSQGTEKSSDRGQDCPLTPDKIVLSERTAKSSDRGQDCPLSEGGDVRHIESQLEQKSPFRVSGSAPHALEGYEAKITSLLGYKQVQERQDLIQKVQKAETAEQRAFFKERLAIVEKVIYGGEPPKAAPAAKRPAKAPAKAPEPTAEELLEGARYMVSVGKDQRLSDEQRVALAGVGELPDDHSSAEHARKIAWARAEALRRREAAFPQGKAVGK